MNLIEAIKARMSVRGYDGQPLTSEQIGILNSAICEAGSPFGGDVTIRLKEFDLHGSYRPSTYGTITGARSFILMALGSDDASALSGGFMMEQVVLRATEIGLGTCWIAATFRGSDFEKGERWDDGKSLRIISPVGIPAAKRSLKERLMRFAVVSARRKSFGELFFSDGFTKPLDETDRYAEALAMMRLAPSSTNSQPWRAISDGSTVHFYYKPKSALSVLDCGIGLYHFFATEQLRKREGKFFTAATPPAAPGNLIYLTSYTEA